MVLIPLRDALRLARCVPVVVVFILRGALPGGRSHGARRGPTPCPAGKVSDCVASLSSVRVELFSLYVSQAAGRNSFSSDPFREKEGVTQFHWGLETALTLSGTFGANAPKISGWLTGCISEKTRQPCGLAGEAERRGYAFTATVCTCALLAFRERDAFDTVGSSA
jgi:hypothetical protein